MNHDMSHANDVAPWYITMFRNQLVGQVVCELANLHERKQNHFPQVGIF